MDGFWALTATAGARQAFLAPTVEDCMGWCMGAGGCSELATRDSAARNSACARALVRGPTTSAFSNVRASSLLFPPSPLGALLAIAPFDAAGATWALRDRVAA
ncbi:hypothetical protein M427DRAFT_62372 [Gonapodya prolifera JEL478]|uniref:Uncharacterized protein n=1 Tax=Gonapodya prolifera (strain JEL478) TaxID=1344416 RepID=A0A139A0T7_GONPJ|nr:hypothetical protein M427DRAFT_62372 [Gonapodya prolifera JEL478]|eukprot:KXS10397.1 hypothetical protein M427DRAFT_62372 [Gonapodya prolifera JEL478]